MKRKNTQHKKQKINYFALEALEKKEKISSYSIPVVIALIFIIGLVIFAQYNIGKTSALLDKITTSIVKEKQSGGAGQTAPAGISPQMGIQYNGEGYKMMLNYYKTIKLSAADSKKVAGLDVTLPCCGFKNILVTKDGTSDFENSCHCGHHDAMYGLAKYMVQKGYSREDMQKELNVWKGVFFPTSGGGDLGGCV